MSSQWTGSEDWFEWVLYVDWHEEKWQEMQLKLEELKAIAEADVSPEEWDCLCVNEFEVNVEPCGARLGKGKKGPYYAYKAEYGGLDVMIAKCSTAKGNVPNVVIRASGEVCLLIGVETCLKRGRNFVAGIGGTIRKDKLSRVDIALDMPGVGMSDFKSAFDGGKYICRAKSLGWTQSNGLTLKFGESPLLLRIYDKLAETLKCDNPRKVYAMIKRRWGDTIPDQAARVEFEIRREALKNRGIDSVDDYFQKRADLMNYLVHEWFRLTTETVDRKNKNQSRAEVLPLWKDVQTAFESWAGSPAGCSLEPLSLEAVDVTQMFKQALGVIRTAAQCQGRNYLSTEELLSYAMFGLRLTATWVPTRHKKRRARHIVKISSACDVVDLTNTDPAD
jgi:hypothetical protein